MVMDSIYLKSGQIQFWGSPRNPDPRGISVSVDCCPCDCWDLFDDFDRITGDGDTVQGSSSEMVSDEVLLSTEGTLASGSAGHDTTDSGATISVDGTLGAIGALHAHTSDGVVVATFVSLAIDNADHVPTSDSAPMFNAAQPDVAASDTTSGGTISIQSAVVVGNASHDQSASTASIIALGSADPDDSSHVLESTGTLATFVRVEPDNAEHGSESGGWITTLVRVMPEDAGHILDSTGLIHMPQTVDIQDASHEMTSDGYITTTGCWRFPDGFTR